MLEHVLQHSMFVQFLAIYISDFSCDFSPQILLNLRHGSAAYFIANFPAAYFLLFHFLSGVSFIFFFKGKKK